MDTKPSPIFGLAVLLGLQAAGEVSARGLGLPFPGPVIGLLLLVLALHLPWVRHHVVPTADTLLSHLSRLFVPVGVGVIMHLDVLGEHGAALLISLILSTWIGLLVTALVLRCLMRSKPAAPSDDAGDGV
jgi:holin-like protein